MRQILPLTLLIVVTTALGADSSDSEIRHAQETFGRCWEAHGKDLTCMDGLLTQDFNAVTLPGRPLDRAAFIDLVHRLPETNTWKNEKGEYLPSDATVRFYGNTAVVAYGMVHKIPVEHVDQFTHVYVKTDGHGWQLARLYASHPNLPTQSNK